MTDGPAKAGARALVLMVLATSLVFGSCDARERATTSAVPQPVLNEGGIGSLYENVLEPLRGALRQTHSDDPQARVEALEQMRPVLEPIALSRLSELLADPHEVVRTLAVELVGSLGDDAQSVVGDLVPRLTDTSRPVRDAGLQALARIGGDEALQALLERLPTAVGDEKLLTIESIGLLGRIEAVADLVPLLSSDDMQRVAAATLALERIGPSATNAVSPLLDAEAPSARCAALGLLARWEVDTGDRLRALARHDSEPSVRFCALGAMGRRGDEEAVERLTAELADPDSVFRSEAASALGVVASGAAIRALIRALTSFHQSDAPNTQNPAQRALLDIGVAARPPLEEALPAGTPLRRALVAETLGALGDLAALESLERAALDTDPLVRDSAEAALELLRE